MLVSDLPFASPINRVLACFGRRQAGPAPSATARAAVLDCLRVRDLGGDWLDHPSFEAGAHSDKVRDSLVRDGLAFWDDFGIHITARGRRAWAEQRRALRDLAGAMPAPAPLLPLSAAFALRREAFGPVTL